MNIKSLLFILLCSYSFSQENILNLNKAEESKFVLDGILSEQELENSVELEILYEHEPGYNITPEYKTTGYLIYTDTFLYVGFKAYRDEVIASIHPRDNRSLFNFFICAEKSTLFVFKKATVPEGVTLEIKGF